MLRLQAVEEGAHEMETLDIAVTIVETLNSARQRDNDEDEEDEEDEDDEAPWPPRMLNTRGVSSFNDLNTNNTRI